MAGGGEWSASRPGCFTLNEKKTSVPTAHDLSWSPHRVWTLFKRESLSLQEFEFPFIVCPSCDIVTVATELYFKDFYLLTCDSQSLK